MTTSDTALDTAAWLAQVAAQNPCKRLPNGHYRTCPARLSYPHLLVKRPPLSPEGKPAWGTSLLFPTGADLSVLRTRVAELLEEKFKGQSPLRLHTPFRDQAEYSGTAGYVDGATFISPNNTTDTPPTVVKPGMIPATAADIYPGQWCIATISIYAFDVTKKRGVTCGLEGILLLGVGERLAGVSRDPVAAFGDVNLSALAGALFD